MRRIAAFALVLMGLTSAAPAPVALGDRLTAERQALRDARAERTAAEARVRLLEAQANDARGAAERSARALAALRGQVTASESDIRATEVRLALVRGLQRERASRLGDQRQPVVQLMAALEARRRRPAILALLEPGSLDDLIHTRAVLATITPVVQARTAALKTDLDEARALDATARSSLAALRAARGRLIGDQTRLAAAERRARDSGTALSGAALNEGDRALALGEQAFDIADRLGDLNAAQTTAARLAPLPAPTLRPGTAAAPHSTRLYRLPVSGEVVTGLGEVADTGVTSKGLSFRTAPGTIVRAPAAGRVAFSGPYRGFGPVLILDHGGGWTTLLTGLSVLGVAVDQQVDQGAIIARAVGGGRALTVELRRGDRMIDLLAL